MGSVYSTLLFSNSAAAELCSNSWFWEECPLVCHLSTGTEVTKLINTVSKLNNYRGPRGPAKGRIGFASLLLL